MYVPLILLLHMTEKKAKGEGGGWCSAPIPLPRFMHACIHLYIHH